MRLHRYLRLVLLSGAVLLAAGCASTLNVVSEGGDKLMLGGNDPVAYFAAGRALPGRPELKAEHRGVVYRFASEDNRRAFITSPARYLPQFGGFCAARMAYAVPIPARNEQFKIVGGRLYVFSSARARALFEMDQEKNLKLAEFYWDAEVKDSNWHFQSIKRQLFTVPEYKSHDQLTDEYEKRFGKRRGKLGWVHVLFVCTGNIFRSLTAERALRRALGASEVVVSSAGTDDYPHLVSPLVRDHLLTRGYDVSSHRRRTLTADILRDADLAVAMSTNHRDIIARSYGLKVPLFLEACGLDPAPLPDIDEAIADYRTNHEAVAAHVRMTIDRIIELAPRMAASLDRPKA